MVGLAGEVAGGEPDLAGVLPCLRCGCRAGPACQYARDLPPRLDAVWAVMGHVGLLGRPELKISLGF
jgi:hypothetical protein